MRKAALFLAACLMLIGFSGAVVYENGSSPSNNVSEGEMGITSAPSSSASGSTAAGPNGTQYSSKVEMAGRDGPITNESVTAPVFTDTGNKTRVQFNGSITSPDLCHVIDQETDETGENSYSINVQTVKDEPDNGTVCGQAQTMIDYNAEFEAEKPYNLTVLHNDEEMETFTAKEDIAGPEPEPRKRGIIGSIFDFFTGLF
jgi:hypothetical protein